MNGQIVSGASPHGKFASRVYCPPLLVCHTGAAKGYNLKFGVGPSRVEWEQRVCVFPIGNNDLIVELNFLRIAGVTGSQAPFKGCLQDARVSARSGPASC